MSTSKKTLHQARTEATREQVLTAAERVFVEEGFERAQIETIAQVAGRTKGAVYANFKNKDDLFLAVCEKHTRQHINALLEALTQCDGHAEAMAAFLRYITSLSTDRSWPLLVLEFKLYSLRHPEAKDRWVPINNTVTTGESSALIRKLYGDITPAQKKTVTSNMAAIAPILSGLLLEAHFEPELLSPKRVTALLKRLLAVLVEQI